MLSQTASYQRMCVQMYMLLVDFFWKNISFIFLGVSIVSFNIMAGFSL